MAIAFVRSAKAGALSTNVQTVTATLGANSTAGNLLVAAVMFSSGNVPITAPTNWLSAVVVNAQTRTLQIFYYPNTVGGQTSFAFSTTAAAAGMSCIVAEFSGLATTSPLEFTATNNGSSASMDSGTTHATQQANELWWGVLGYAGGTTRTISGITNSFTADLIEDASSSGAAGVHISDYYKIVSATGTADVGATLSSGSGWVGLMATFKSTGGGGTRTVPTTAALQSTLTRTVPTSAALQATLTRTVPASAALQSTLTRTVPTTAALQATLARMVPASAALLATNIRTIPATAALLATNTRTVPSSAALLSTLARSVPTSAALLATLSRSVPATTALLATLTRTIPSSAALLQTSTRTVPTNVALQATLARTVPAQVALLATLTRMIPVTVALSSSAPPGPSPHGSTLDGPTPAGTTTQPSVPQSTYPVGLATIAPRPSGGTKIL